MTAPRKPYWALRSRIFESGLTQINLAEKLGITDSTLARYLSGKADIGLKTIWQLMRILEIDPSDFGRYFPEGGNNDAYIKELLK